MKLEISQKTKPSKSLTHSRMLVFPSHITKSMPLSLTNPSSVTLVISPGFIAAPTKKLHPKTLIEPFHTSTDSKREISTVSLDGITTRKSLGITARSVGYTRTTTKSHSLILRKKNQSTKILKKKNQSTKNPLQHQVHHRTPDHQAHQVNQDHQAQLDPSHPVRQLTPGHPVHNQEPQVNQAI